MVKQSPAISAIYMPVAGLRIIGCQVAKIASVCTVLATKVLLVLTSVWCVIIYFNFLHTLQIFNETFTALYNITFCSLEFSHVR